MSPAWTTTILHLRGRPADEQRGGGHADMGGGWLERGDSAEMQGYRADEARLDQPPGLPSSVGGTRLGYDAVDG